MIIDHIGLGVEDYERAKAFYSKALAPLGIRIATGVGGPEGHNIEAVCHRPE